MGKRDREKQKERQVAALEEIYQAFWSLRADAAREMEIPESTLNRALNRSNPGLMRNDTRLKVARFLGRRCGSEEELSRLLAETGWEMGEEEWEAAVECAVGERPVLHGAPRLSEGRVGVIQNSR